MNYINLLLVMLMYSEVGYLVWAALNASRRGKYRSSSLFQAVTWPFTLLLFVATLPLHLRRRRALRAPAGESALDRDALQNDARERSIAFWRERLTSGSPVEQDVARQMLRDVFEVPEQTPTLPQRVAENMRFDRRVPVPAGARYCAMCRGRLPVDSVWTTVDGHPCTACDGIGYSLRTFEMPEYRGSVDLLKDAVAWQDKMAELRRRSIFTGETDA
jgi:hypothetical protein